MRSAALGLRFLLELALLAALAFWGFTTPDGALLKILLGAGAPLLAAVVWERFSHRGRQCECRGRSW